MLTPLQERIRAALAGVVGDAEYQIDYHHLRATIAAAAAEVARLHPGPDPSGFDV